MRNFSIDKLPGDIRTELAAKLKTLRKQQGMTQRELAERSGVSLGSLKRFETQGQISLASLLKLVDVLGRLADFEKVLEPVEELQRIEKLFGPKRKDG